MSVLLNDTYNAFLRSRRILGLTDKTIQCYRDFVGYFLNFVDVQYVHELNYEKVCEYIEFLFTKKLSRSTVATYISHVRVYLSWIELEYNVDLQVKKIKVPKTYKKILRIYGDEEILQIFNAVESNDIWIVYRNKTIISLMLDSGLRRSEVCNLRLRDINNGLIKIHGKGNKERVVPLGKLTNSFLQRYLSLAPFVKDYIFVTKNHDVITNNAVKLMIAKLAKKLPFEFSSHKLRHNFATNYCLDQYERYGQIDIYRLMVLMGHEDIETTRRYLHLANQIIASRTNISHLDRFLDVL